MSWNTTAMIGGDETTNDDGGHLWTKEERANTAKKARGAWRVIEHRVARATEVDSGGEERSNDEGRGTPASGSSCRLAVPPACARTDPGCAGASM